MSISIALERAAAHLLVRAPRSDQQVRNAAIYLCLSGITGFVEFGSVVYAACTGTSVEGVLVVALAYQVGALFKTPIDLPGRHYRAMVAAACLVGVFAQAAPILLPVALVLLSGGLQGIREEALQTFPVGTLPKRMSRMLGFTLVGLFSSWALVVVPVLILLFGLLLRQPEPDRVSTPRIVGLHRLGAIGVVMVLHQMHYFAYSYAVPLLFSRIHGLDAGWTGLAFMVGWTSYSCAPLLLGRLPVLPVVIAGHVAVAVLLMLMAATSDAFVPLLVAWFASGFGGGTVFCIKRLAARWAAMDRTGDLDVWENVGHVLGVMLAIGVVLGTGDIRDLFVSGAVLAALVASIIALLGGARRQVAADRS